MADLPIIEVDGQQYEITNWPEFKNKLLNAIGFTFTKAVEDEVRKAKLVDTGEFVGSFGFEIKEDTLTFYSTSAHAPYLEYGTAGTRKGVADPWGEVVRGPNQDRKMPLKKEGNKFILVPQLQYWARRHGFKEKGYFALAKHIQMYGLEPFAPIRKVLYNDAKMQKVIETAANWAAK